MARKPRSVYERIAETESKIASLEEELAQSKSHLIDLLQEKDELEMKETWSLIKEKGLTAEDVQKILLKQNKTV